MKEEINPNFLFNFFYNMNRSCHTAACQQNQNLKSDFQREMIVYSAVLTEIVRCELELD